MSYKTRAIEGMMIAGSLVIMAGIAQNTDIAAMETETETVTAETQAATAVNGRAGVVIALDAVEDRAYESFVEAAANIEQENVTLVGTAEAPLAGVTEALSAVERSAAATEAPLASVAEEQAAAENFVMVDDVTAPEVSAVVDGETAELPVEEVASTGDAAEADDVAGDAAVADDVTEAEETLVAAAAPQTSEDENAWQNRLMADVNDFLYIRAEGNEDAQILGKLYKGDVAEIVEYGEEWTHVTSGNVDGYVKNSYCLFGADAFAYAIETFDMEAEVQTDGLRVRREASEEAAVLAAVSTGMSLTIDSDAEAVDGWVPVSYGGDTAYVSAEYVTVGLALGEAVTLEEEREAQARAAASAARTSSPGTVQNAPVAASVDDLTLLAALIQCEAGNEPYEGQVAVGAVVMNRVRSGGYPSSIYAVIYQPSQFGPAGRGSVASVAMSGPKASCIQAAQAALSGMDNTGGATCFRNVSSGHAGVVIGNHVFW